MADIDKRSEEILSSLIATFSSTFTPVGSSTLARYLGNHYSSATIRNIMNDLEGAGLLTHRHTSGGRIPTEKGIRYYVDKLLKVEQMADDRVEEIRSRYNAEMSSVTSVFKRTSALLSGLSSYAGLVVAPMMKDIVIKQMEFISISKGRVLGIFVGRDGLVENRIIKFEESLTHADIEKINNYCNRTFYGLTLSDAKDKLARELHVAKQEYDKMISRALILSQGLLTDMEKAELFVEGGSQLLSVPEFFDSGKASTLINALDEKRRLIDLLNNALESDTINVFIGSESGYDAVADCSLVSASYGKDGKVLGTLGVIGPKRMDYSKVIPIVDCTARLLSDFLGE